MRKMTIEEHYMKEAIRQAKKAAALKEVPIGCVIVYDGRIIARGYNRRTVDKNVLAHAEIIAMRKACRILGDWRLEDCTMYVTLEPCPMCAGAIVQARIPKVVIGCMNPKAGCAGSVLDMLHEDGFNHQVETKVGLLGEECSQMLKDFFKALREEGKRKKLEQVQKEANIWGKMMRTETVGDLNNQITHQGANELILIAEALQEGKIAKIADQIVEAGHKKFIMIAGPSSSGKTTFSHRLSIQLSAHGLKPHPIAVDNYFVNREHTPLDEEGNYNFECLEAIDVKQFNNDMNALLRGEEVEIPTYNFKTGKREYKGNFLKLEESDILVIEGIHCLNDRPFQKKINLKSMSVR